ncbi:MAG TPA: histidine kinase [Burkholderiaceae bacterium]|nr:histidine kinase [Burkholderiaceae bacterium]
MTTDSNSQALSTLIFDACKVGVILRAVLFVQVVMGAVVMFTQSSVSAWMSQLAMLMGGSVPATLLWLVAACSLQRPLQSLSLYGQYMAGFALGVLAGFYACGMLLFVGLVTPAPWLASGVAGGLLATALVAALVWRAKGRMPAATAARLADLQSRIRPHFLFNTLNSAIALVREEPRKAEKMLEDLSDLFRQALAEHGDAVTLAQEVELAKHYLAIEQVRFADRLRVDWQIDTATLGAKLPPLMLQPLIENAIHHGVEPSPNGASVVITAKRDGSKVVIEISNTLPSVSEVGLAQKHKPVGMGIALQNVRERLSLLHDIESGFQAGVQGNQFVVRIELPL